MIPKIEDGNNFGVSIQVVLSVELSYGNTVSSYKTPLMCQASRCWFRFRFCVFV